MKSNKTPLTFRLEPEDNNRLLSLCGEYNENLKQVEKRFKVSVSHRGHLFYVDGETDNVNTAGKVLHALYEQTKKKSGLGVETVHLILSQGSNGDVLEEASSNELVVRIRKFTVRGRNQHQRSYLRDIKNCLLYTSPSPRDRG